MSADNLPRGFGVLHVARCPEHGWRIANAGDCLWCDSPVEQVPMVPMRERDELQRRIDAVQALCDGAISRSERVGGALNDVDFGFIKGCGALALDIRRLLDGEGDDE